MRVLFVIDGLGQGGAERSLAELVPALTRANIEVVVAFFYRREGSLESVFRAQGTRLHFLPQKGFLRRVTALRRLIRTVRPDIIHTALFESDMIGRLASVGQNAVVMSSLVNTPYDPIRLQNSDVAAPKLWAVRFVDSWTARHLTTCFHAISEPVKKAAVETLRLQPERITVIERGRSGRFDRPDAERRPLARQKFGLAESDEVIVNVARQEYQKGQRYLFEAMVEVARRRPNAVLLLAGRCGRQTEALWDLHRALNLGDRVRILGHRDDVPDLLAAADVFVFPSLYEGLGGALIEAMGLGLPVVASKIPAIESVVEEGRNALLVERAAVGPLADAIVQLLGDRARARAFGNRSREIFEERFTLDRCAARMVEFYSRLAGRGPERIPASATT